MSAPKARISWVFPAPVLLAIIAQTAVAVWICASWKTTIESTLRILESRIAAVESNATNNLQMIERVKGVEVNVEVLKAQSQNIETKIDKLIDRGMK